MKMLFEEKILEQKEALQDVKHLADVIASQRSTITETDMFAGSSTTTGAATITGSGVHAPGGAQKGRLWMGLGVVVAVLLAGGLALLGVLNHRRTGTLAQQALEGRALEIGLGSAAALMTFRPRGRERLQAAVSLLPEDHVRVAAVVSRKGRVIASSREAERGQSLRGNASFLRLKQGRALYAVSRISGVSSIERTPVYFPPGASAARDLANASILSSGRSSRVTT